jgi:pimeloyl-ACP methyl ester carboxylesterase
MATPIWFGTDDRPLFGVFHTPTDGRARAGAVICPPFDRDYMHAHYALRLLAERLAEHGVCVLRFDYDGTGDSAGGPQDPDRVAAWLGSVDAALDVVRAAGAETTVLIGMRIGATFAGAVAERRRDVDDLVLWDPVTSGKAYLSEQRALSALSFTESTDRDDGAVETPGMRFEAPTVEALRAVDLTKTVGPLAERVLVLPRPEKPLARLAKRLDQPHVEWSEVTGQAELMDTGSPNQVMPYDDIDRIAGWVSSAVPATSARLQPPEPAGAATIGRLDDGTAIVETPTALGPAGLFGVVTDVPGRTGGPTAVFLNVANEHRLGPARLWVDLARQWAASGIRSVRFDLSGLGDSPTRQADQPRFVTRAPESFDDVIDVCRAVSPDDPSNVVLFGLCASAYQALDSAFDVFPRGVVSINPILSFLPPELVTGDTLDPRRHVAIPRPSAMQAFRGDGKLAGLRKRFPRLAVRGRELSEMLEALTAARERRPAAWLKKLTDAGVDVLLICGDREARPIKLSGTTWSFRRLERTGRYRLDLIPGLEHALLITDQRADVRRRVTEYMHRLAVAGQAPGRPVPGRPTTAHPAPVGATAD